MPEGFGADDGTSHGVVSGALGWVPPVLSPPLARASVTALMRLGHPSAAWHIIWQADGLGMTNMQPVSKRLHPPLLIAWTSPCQSILQLPTRNYCSVFVSAPFTSRDSVSTPLSLRPVPVISDVSISLKENVQHLIRLSPSWPISSGKLQPTAVQNLGTLLVPQGP